MIQLPINQERLSTLQIDEIMAEHLHRYAIALEFTAGKTVLDLASGEGYGSSLLSKNAKMVFGVDISDEAIGHSKQKYQIANLEFRQGNATDIPLPDNYVDLIVSFETLEHHDQHEKMMEEFKRVLKPDGLLIISSPDKLNYSDLPNYNNQYHIKELYFTEFKSLLSKYFKNMNFLNQRYFTGSVIESINHSESELLIFEGNYQKIKLTTNVVPMYNIALVSDFQITSVPSSIFSHLILKTNNLEEIEKKYLNSTTWKVGKFVLYPFHLFKRILSK